VGVYGAVYAKRSGPNRRPDEPRHRVNHRYIGRIMIAQKSDVTRATGTTLDVAASMLSVQPVLLMNTALQLHLATRSIATGTKT